MSRTGDPPDDPPGEASPGETPPGDRGVEARSREDGRAVQRAVGLEEALAGLAADPELTGVGVLVERAG